jgi:mono/diheme cytochrome c family protein
MISSTRALALWALALAGCSDARGAQSSGFPAFHPRTVTPFAAAEAEALLRDRLPCLGCHQLGGSGGRIGPDLTTVAQRRSPAFIRAMIADPQGTVPGTVMPKTPMPAEVLDLVASYLATREMPAQAPLDPTRLPPGAPRPTPADGAALYARYCATCHGPAGKGDGPNARYLPIPPAIHASAERMSLRPDDVLYDMIAGGGYIMNRSNRMPAFGETLRPDEIGALVAHIRVLCACAGPAWSRDGRAAR